MTRLEKKCIVGSASLHGLLLLVFLFSSAFSTSKKKQVTLPVVTIMGAIATDRLISTGGSPKGSPTPPASAPKPEPIVPPTPPPPQPEPPKPEPVKPPPVKPEPVVKQAPPVKPVVKVAPKAPDKPLQKADFVAAKAKPKPETKKVEAPPISTKIVKRTVDTGKLQREREERERAARLEQQRKEYARQMAAYERSNRDLANKFNGMLSNVGKDVGKGTDVEPLGSGGVAYVHYGSLIREIYDRAWNEPPSLTDDDGNVKAKITISRSGQVISAKVVGRSGIPALDKSVERVLREVRVVPPFPSETTDSERTFTINFNLKAKRMST